MLPDLHIGFSRGRSGGLVFPSLEEFSTVYCDPHKSFGIVNKAEIDIFLELSCFFDDPADVGNLVSLFWGNPIITDYIQDPRHLQHITAMMEMVPIHSKQSKKLC